LQQPLNYPRLTDSFVEGDRVAITLDPAVPEVENIIAILYQELSRSGFNADMLSIVAVAEQLESLKSMSIQRNAALAEAAWIAHHPAEETELAYLAATQTGRPIYLQRVLCEADVVIPIGLAHATDSLAECGAHGAWFPTFSNVEAQARFAAAGNLQWETHHRRRREEAQEAAWLLGVNFVVQCLPGAAGSVAEVFCGEAQAVERAAKQYFEQHWRYTLSQEPAAALLVIDGPAAQQTWRNVAHALHMAARVVPEDGTIILCTDLTEDPGPALDSLQALELSEHEHELALLKIKSADALAAKVLHDVLRTHRIFIRSQLDDAVVENLGLGAWHTSEQLQRLIHEHPSCVVVGSAQHAALQLASSMNQP
jgi:nickel-dependent lactate racemase